MSNVLVTGASGFIGSRLCSVLAQRENRVRRIVRSKSAMPSIGDTFVLGDISATTDWSAALDGIEVIVHLAGRAHVLRDAVSDPLAEFRRVNVGGTMNLARQAAVSGVRRFVFISSIGVNGAETRDAPFTAEDRAAPRSPYAISKYEAELGLRRLAEETGLEVVIIRPPLVFGPGAPGNFHKLILQIQRGFPLPFGAVQNQRSLVALDNLVDLIVLCLNHPKAANQTFLVSDDEDVSTPQLLRRLSCALSINMYLIPVPVALLKLVARLIGRQEIARQLLGSLRVDITKTRNILGWSPLVTVDEGLSKATREFLKGKAMP